MSLEKVKKEAGITKLSRQLINLIKDDYEEWEAQPLKKIIESSEFQALNSALKFTSKSQP